jgi:segregation and condensation protein B
VETLIEIEAVKEKESETVDGVPLDGLAPKVEAMLFSVDRPMPALKLAEALGMLPAEENRNGEKNGTDSESGSTSAKVRNAARRDAAERIERAVAWLNTEYERTGRAFRIESLAGGFRVMTLPRFASVVGALVKARSSQRLSRQALETLAIIAYRQPITRAQLEAIRGVSCGEVLRNLVERRLVTVAGRAEELGRPLLYATTREFLNAFGLASLKDLPMPEEIGLGSPAAP